MKRMNALALVALLSGTAGAQMQMPLIVTNAADAGEGTLRSALVEAAKRDQSARVVIATDEDIVINDSLAYFGEAPLEIVGNGQLVRSAENVDLLVVANGADLAIRDLGFEGPGQFSILNRGDVEGQTAGKGIFVDVREDQTGTVEVALDNVSVKGVANHGIHVSDCTLADDCGGGAGGGGEGSPASIDVRLNNVTVDGVGNGKFDADGLRVDERDQGDIRLHVIGSEFARVGADGLELDEGQAGSIHATTIRTAFIDNGAYCDPAMLEAYMPAQPEAEFDDGEVSESDIPGAVTGTPDDTCFEREVDRYDSGSIEAYEIGIDVDDGIDFDEADAGDLNLTMMESRIAGNYDEGVDMDEAGPGDGNLQYVNTTSYRNADDGFKMSEEDAGSVNGLMVASVSRDNGGKGAVFEEEGDGNVAVTARSTDTRDNDDSQQTGFEVVQEDAGTGRLTISDSRILDGIEAEGVTVNP
jgi:hypothetical protein